MKREQPLRSVEKNNFKCVLKSANVAAGIIYSCIPTIKTLCWLHLLYACYEWMGKRDFIGIGLILAKNAALYSMFRFAVETQCKKCRIGKACMENASYSVPVYNRVAFCI